MIGPLLRHYDRKVREFVDALCEASLSQEAWAQAQLPNSKGGLGLRSAEASASCSFLASVSSTREMVNKLSSPGGANEWETKAVRDCSAFVPGDVLAKVPEGVKQKELNDNFDKLQLERLQQHGSAVTTKRLKACSQPFADGWLRVVPPRVFDTLLSNDNLRDSLRLRVGVETGTGDSHCPFCCQLMDAYGHHALSCMSGGDCVGRHNAVRNTFFKEAVKARFRPVLEKAGILPDQRPADIFLHVGPSAAQSGRRHFDQVAWDFAAISPYTPARLRDATDGANMAAYAEQKRQKLDTASRCEGLGVAFEPIVFEAAGGVELGGKRVLEGLFKAMAANADSTPQEVTERVMGRTSIDLQRAWHRSLSRRTTMVYSEDDSPVSEYYSSWAPEGASNAE